MLLWLALFAVSVDAPVVHEVRVAGAGNAREAVRARLDAILLGQPARPEVLADAVRRIEDVGRGGIDVGVRERGRVVFRFDGRPRRVGTLRLAEGHGAPDDVSSWRLARQIQSVQRPFALEEGRPFHPYLGRVDVQAVRRYYLDRGHLDVDVLLEVAEEKGGLVGVVVRVQPGPRYHVGAVGITGYKVDEGVLDQLHTKVGDGVRPAPWRLDADAERLRAHVCRRGHPRARVETQQRAKGEALSVDFVVTPGPRARVGFVGVEGRAVSKRVLAELPVRPGVPFCPDLLRDSERILRRHLRDSGHLDATVDGEARIVKGEARVVIRVETNRPVYIERIWFAGNEVTRENVLRLLVDIPEGALYRQSSVDEAVQTLRRSGLFRVASAEVTPGGPGACFLTFNVVERDLVSIDVVERTMVLRNLDLSHVSPEVELLAKGAVLRGAGEELTVYAQDTWQGLRYVDRFDWPYAVLELAANRRTREFGAPLSETWYDGWLGLGVEVLGHRASLVPLLQVEWAEIEGQAVEGVASGSFFDLGVGARASLDVSRLDEERVRYLGVELGGRYLYSAAGLGADVTMHRVLVDGTLHLPLGTNGGGQHFVLSLGAGFRGLEVTDGAPAPHQRPRPTIRGYGELVVRREVEGEMGMPETVEIGPERTTEGSLELRIPMPYARRHAVSPFIDGATLADDGDDSLSNGRVASGVAYRFSFFDERLEGYVYGVYPLVDDPAAEYFGFAVDGSF